MHGLRGIVLTTDIGYRGSNSGCRHAPRCLACPFEDCIDSPGPARDRWLAARDAEIRRLHSQMTYAEIAPRFGLSPRAIRAICTGEGRQKGLT